MMKARARFALIVALVVSASTALGQAPCPGVNPPPAIPFTDAEYGAFCRTIATAYLAGLTNGISPTLFGPTIIVDRGQMSAFVSRTLDQSLKRGSQRAALDQWWTTRNSILTTMTYFGGELYAIKSDGVNLWIADRTSGICRVSPNGDMATWTGSGTKDGYQQDGLQSAARNPL